MRRPGKIVSKETGETIRRLFGLAPLPRLRLLMNSQKKYTITTMNK